MFMLSWLSGADMSNKIKIKKNNTPKFLKDFVKENCKYLALDLKDGVLYSHQLKTSLVAVYSLTSKLAEGVFMRNWFWVGRDQVELVNTELKFKLNDQALCHLKLSWDKAEKLNSASEYVSIDGGLTGSQLPNLDEMNSLYNEAG